MVLETGLQGTHVLVTGGTRGIGKSIVEAFLSEGANVSYCARTVSGDEFASFQAANGAQAIGTSVDIGVEEKVTEWVNSSHEKFGRIDTVIANASPLIFDDSISSWKASFAIDMLGCVTLINAARPYLVKSKNASITILSSYLAREFSRPPASPYGPMKAAQLQYVQELSHILGPEGIRTNALSPGGIYFPGGSWEYLEETIPDWVKQQRDRISLRRLGEPQEIANATVWMSSVLASYVCGANILVDGGIHHGTQF